MENFYYQDMWSHFTNLESNDDFDETNELIITIYKRSKKYNKKNQLDLFHHEQRRNNIYRMKTFEQAHPNLFKNGLFLCNNSKPQNKTLLFVFPKYDKLLDCYFANHWHFLLKSTEKKGVVNGFHETSYGYFPGDENDDGNQDFFINHKYMDYPDPIPLAKSSYETPFFSEYNKRISKKRALLHLIRCENTIKGGSGRGVAGVTKQREQTQTQTFTSRKLSNFFDNLDTGFETPGIKRLVILSIKRPDNTYDHTYTYDPKGKKIRDGVSNNSVFATYRFNTQNTNELEIRRELLANISN